MTLGQVFSIILGVSLGLLAGWKRKTKIDISALTFSRIMWAVPTFWLGIMLLALGSSWLGLPTRRHAGSAEHRQTFSGSFTRCGAASGAAHAHLHINPTRLTASGTSLITSIPASYSRPIAKIERRTGHEGCRQAIANGVAYYVGNLFDERGLPKPFSRAPRLTVYRQELYDYAECINLCALLKGRFPELDERLSTTLRDLLDHWVKRDGSFRSRRLMLGWDNVPMHRWAQS